MNQVNEQHPYHYVRCETQHTLFVSRAIFINSSNHVCDLHVNLAQSDNSNSAWKKHQLLTLDSYQKLPKAAYDNSTDVLSHYQGGVSPCGISFKFDALCQNFNSYHIPSQLSTKNPINYFNSPAGRNQMVDVSTVNHKGSLPVGMLSDLQTNQNQQHLLKNAFNLEAILSDNTIPLCTFENPDSFRPSDFQAQRMSFQFLESQGESLQHLGDPKNLCEGPIQAIFDASVVQKETSLVESTSKFAAKSTKKRIYPTKTPDSRNSKEFSVMRARIKRLNCSGLTKLTTIIDNFYNPKVMRDADFPQNTLFTLLVTTQAKITVKTKPLARRYLEFILLEWSDLPDRQAMIDYVLAHFDL
jgi:hypothetical protein